MKTNALAVAFLLTTANFAHAQFAPEHIGFVGSFDLGATRVAIGNAPNAWQKLWGARVGHRWSATDALRIGAMIELHATNLRGMKVGRDSYAFSVGDVGPEVTLRVHDHLRLTSRALVGFRTAESVEATHVWNYSGNGKTFGFGVEIPMTGEGRGIAIEANHVQGTFTKKEFLRDERPTDTAVAGWTLSVGWGGPLHIGPFWK